MIIVDTSVWIDLLNGRDALHVRRLRSSLDTAEVVIGDLILCEVLQGFATEREALAVERSLRGLPIVRIVDDSIAVASARNFRRLRSLGVTIRKTIDLLIGTWCIEHNVPLLHNDRDFTLMARHLRLVEA